MNKNNAHLKKIIYLLCFIFINCILSDIQAQIPPSMFGCDLQPPVTEIDLTTLPLDADGCAIGDITLVRNFESTGCCGDTGNNCARVIINFNNTQCGGILTLDIDGGCNPNQGSCDVFDGSCTNVDNGGTPISDFSELSPNADGFIDILICKPGSNDFTVGNICFEGCCLPPVLTCPLDANIECDESVDPNINASLGFPISSAGCGITTYSFEDFITPGACPSSYTIDRRWIALDEENNRDTCFQTINVTDSTLPVAPAAPADILEQCSASIPPAEDLTATDNCDGLITVSPTEETTPGDCSNTFTLVRTWTFSDSCGNSSAVSQIISIEDTEAPIAPAAPADISGQCGGVNIPPPVELTATDNCDGVIAVLPTEDITPGACANAFVLVRTWTFTDACGNTSAVSQTINIGDTEAPVAPTSPADINGQCSGNVPPAVDLTATDNCDGPITVSPTEETIPGACPSSFTLVRTWTFTDACGNTSAVSQTINIGDTEAPVTPTPPADVNGDCNTDVPAAVNLTATDNCDGAIVASSVDDLVADDCPDSFTLIRTWTFTDACGNTSSVSQTITINDTTAPVIPTAPIDVTGQCAGDVPPPVDLTATNNCGADITVSPTEEMTPGVCPNSFTLVRTWTFTDVCNNTSFVSQTITIEDTEAPVAPAPPADVNGQCGGDVPPPVDLTATDNCDGSITVSPTEETTPGACPSSFTLVRTWTFTDACGNTSSIFQTITVGDTEAPVVPVPPTDVNEQCGSDVPPPVDLTAMDNCDGSITVSPTEETTPGACPSSFTLVRTWVFTDACGNASSVAQTIIVGDTEAPVPPAPPVDVNGQCGGDVPPPIDLTAIDNCDGGITVSPMEDITPGNCESAFVIVRTWGFTDACGNTSSVAQTITIGDTTPPIPPAAPTDVFGQCDGDIPAMINLEAMDNCDGIISVAPTDETIPGACPTAFTIIRTWTFTDACGNTSSVAQTIEIGDTTPPELPIPPANEVLECGVLIPAAVPLTATDNCDGPITVFPTEEITAGECNGESTIIRTWTFTDACGNTSSISRNINIIDTAAPSPPLPPADITIECSDPVPVAAVLTGIDVCTGNIIGNSSDNTLTGNCADEAVITRTWTFTDDCGNASSVSQTITIEDSTPPVVPIPPADVTVECASDIPAPIDLTATNNCGADVTVAPTAEIIPGDCANSFTMIRTWDFSDACGNNASTSQTITVDDITPPVITCPAGDSFVACTNIAPPALSTLSAFLSQGGTIDDNCGDQSNYGFSVSTTTSGRFCPTDPFTVTHTYTITDECGNARSCDQVFTIASDTGPEILTCPMMNGGNVMCAADIVLDPDAITYITDCNFGATVEIGGPQIVGPAECPGTTYTYTYAVVDECGRIATCDQVFTIMNMGMPEIVCPAGITVSCEEEIEPYPYYVEVQAVCGADYDVNVSGPVVIGTPNCPGTTYTYTYQATDACGRISPTCTQTFEIENQLPVVYCPEGISLECSNINSDAIIQEWLASATGFAYCSLGYTISNSYNENGFNGICGSTGTQEVTFTVTDACGRTASCTSELTITDTTAPYFTFYPEDQEVECDGNGNEAAFLQWLEENASAEAIDACGGVIFETEPPNPNLSDLCGETGGVRVEFIAIDSCGNRTSEFATFRILDNLAPVITVEAQDEDYGECDGGFETAFNNWLNNRGGAQASDICGDITWTRNPVDPILGNCSGTGTVYVEFIATDDCGNSASTGAAFTVTDTQAPTITSVPADATIECGGIIPTAEPSATDVCGDVVINSTETMIPGDCCGNYTIERTWTATDDCGNATNYDQTIVVQDTQAPVITFTDPILAEAGNGGEIEIACNDGFPTFDENDVEVFDACCGEVAVTLTDPIMDEGVCTETGYVFIMECIWTAVDDCGNESSISVFIKFIDNEAPMFTTIPADVTIGCNDDTPDFEMPTATDDCGDVTLSFEDETLSGDCTEGRVFVRTWTATDLCGNTTTVQQTITAEADMDAPMFTSIPDNLNVSCGETAEFGEAIAEDACSMVVLTSEDTETQEGCTTTRTRTWTATDGCGNSTTASQTITETDNESPQFSFVPADATIICGEAPTFGDATAVDNCGDATVTFEDMPVDGDCSTGITYTRIWTATDECGNTSTASQVIEQLPDNIPPSFDFVPADQTIACTETPTYGEPQVSDICGNVSLSSEDASNEEGCSTTYTRTWTATDECGNTAQAIQTITATDNSPPMFTSVPDNQSINCGDDPSFGQPTAVDDCGTVTLTSVDENQSGDCTTGQMYMRIWTATDECGNTSTAVQTVIETPDFNPPTFTFVPDSYDISCEEEAIFGDATASDDCGAVSLTFEDSGDPAVCDQDYNLTRTWTATDECGNVAQAVQVITVWPDVEPPYFTEVPPSADVNCDFDVVFGEPMVFDNCGDITLVVEDTGDPAVCDEDYTLTRTWTATDECGNVASVSQSFTIWPDVEPPSFMFIPSDITLNCIDDLMFGDPTVTDVCSNFTLTFEDTNSGTDCVTEGLTTTRTWTATDDCGNVSTASQSIYQQQAPTFSLSFITVPASLAGECGEDLDFGAVEAFSNCAGAVTITHEDVVQEGNCANDYTMIRTWTATDECGNLETVSQSITISDTTAPIFDAIPTSLSSVCTDTPAFADPVATDECSDVFVEFTDSNSAGDCTTGYSVTRTWIATDACGNTAMVNQTITMEPITTEIAFLNIPTDDYVACSGEMIFGTPQTYSSCGAVELNFEDVMQTGTCENAYSIIRTWTASDECGNVATASQILTMEDNELPSFDMNPISQTIGCGDALDFASPIATDNCSEVELTFEDVVTIGLCENAYSTTRTWTAVDACGNVATIAQTLTMEDSELPSFDMNPISQTIGCGEALNFASPIATDDCSGVELTFEDVVTSGLCENAYSTTRTWTAVDACGNVATIAQTIDVEDNEAPVFTTVPSNFTTPCGQSPVFATPVATDNCGVVDISFTDTNSIGDCSTGYTVTRTWTAVDGCGNTANVSQQVTLMEITEIAFIVVPSNMTIGCSEVMEFGAAEAYSACSNVELIYTDEMIDGDCAGTYQVTRTWTASDECNNVSIASQTITIEDNQAPVFDFVPMNTAINCSDEIQFGDPLVEDECGTVSLTYSDHTSAAQCSNLTTRVWTAVDACGNIATAEQTIEIVDTAAPEFITTLESLIVSCEDNVSFATPEVIDDCGNVELNFEETTVAGICEGQYMLTRTWTASDACGNVATIAQTATIEDTTPPVFTSVPADQNFSCMDTDISFGEAIVSDECSAIQYSYSDELTVENCIETRIRTWIATDACGNMASASQMLTISDDIPPVFVSLPDNQFVGCADDIVFETATAEDDCSTTAVNFVDVTTAGACEGTYIVTRTWTAVDGCGNVATAERSITVEDNDAPIFEAIPTEQTISCWKDFTFTTPTVDDGCSSVSLEYSDMQVSSDCEETIIRTWTAVDPCGNVATTQETIHLIDNEAPEFLSEIEVEEMTYAEYLSWEVPSLIVEDDCSEVTVLGPYQSTNFHCDTPEVVYNWRATDACGNERLYSTTIYISDANLDCAIIEPEGLMEETGIYQLSATVATGMPPYSFEWRVAEGNWTLAGNTNETMITAGTGNAIVEVLITDAFGCTSNCSVNLTSTELPEEVIEEPIDDSFLVMPNPTKEKLELHFYSAIEGGASLYVYDVLGRLVRTNIVAVSEGRNVVTINVQNLSAATYIVGLEVGEEVYHKKFIKLNY